MERINLSEIDGLNNAVRLCEVNGPYPGNITGTDYLHFKTSDDTNDLNNYMKVPIKGYNYSFAKSIYWEVFDWKKFEDITGIDRIWDIALCMEDYYYEPGIEILVTPTKPLKSYKQATGIIGVTGDSIIEESTSRNFDEFLFNTPCIIASGPFNSEFKSDLVTLQLRISQYAMQGEKRLPKFYVSGVVD